MTKYLVRAQLNSIPTPRFQPTGFPDLGPAKFEMPDGNGGWVDGLLVESEQSMANRLEAQGWDEGTNAPIPLLASLPWVRVSAQDGAYLTSSRTEAHRLASAFVRESSLSDGQSMHAHIGEVLGLADDRPHDRRHMAAAIMRLDPLCLIHGVFFSDGKWQGQPKFARAVVGAIEARDVKEAHSGGVKHDDVSHSNKDGQGSSEGYGTVPFHRTAFTAQAIEAFFAIDRRQLVSYGLSGEATELLFAIAQWEISSFLESGLRLRTACEFEVVDISGELPPVAELEGRISDLIPRCAELEGVAGTTVDIVWKK